MDQPSEHVVEIATNLDDVSGEVIGDAIDALLATSGVLDVWTVAMGMKKDRPGVMLCVLCEAASQSAVAQRVIELTGTFGVRYRTWDRMVLARRHEMVNTRFGEIRIKVGELGGVVVVKPELEDVRAAARQHGVALREVMEAARAAADAWRVSQGSGS